ncbi:tetratricopeptide repeat protein [Desulfobacterales bacterium HSG16]|nr:tetratricopeptide repeat protein [Desulfobacterales bacterium HSG16]
MKQETYNMKFKQTIALLAAMAVFSQIAILSSCTSQKEVAPADTAEKNDGPGNSPSQARGKEYDLQNEKSRTQEFSLSRENRYYYFTEAQLQKRLGNIDKAIEYLNKTIRLDPNSVYLRKDMIDLYLRQKKDEKAMESVRQIITKHPDDIDSLILYGKLQESAKDLDGARKTYEKILKKDPEQREIYLILGSLYLEINESKNAFRTYTQLVKHYPDAYAGYFFLGKIHSNEKEWAEAEKNLLKTLKLRPDIEETRFELITVYKARGKDQKVIELYEEIITSNPSDIKATLGLACHLHKIGKLNEARDFFKKLGKENGSNPEILRSVVRIYVNEKKYDDAAIILDGMIAAVPADSDIRYVAGIVYEGMKKNEEALTHFKKVFPDSTFYQNAAIHAAFIYQEQGKIDEAIKHLNEVISHVPDNPEFLIYLGSFYDEAGQYEKAINILKKGLEIDPGNSRLYFRMGVVYDKWDKKEESIDSMRAVIRLDPKNASALNYLGYTYTELNRNLDEAEQLIKQALKYKPNDGYITDSLGWVYYKRGMYDFAIKHLEEAIKLVPDDPTILEHLGDVWLKKKEVEKAIDYYRKALKKKQDSTILLEEKIKNAGKTKKKSQ